MASTSLPPLELAILAGALSDLQGTRYAELASTIILVYDHLITFEDEVEHIWNKPWSYGKCLFLLNRYYALFVAGFNNYAIFTPFTSKDFCITWLHWQGWSGLATCMLAEVILQFRLYALYNRDKRVTALMLTTFVAAFAVAGYVMYGVLSSLEVIVVSTGVPSGIGPFCAPTNVSPHFFEFWIPILLSESVLCGLALFRGYKALHAARSGPLYRYGNGQLLMETLVRDSGLYFIAIFATYLTCALVWIFTANRFVEIPIGFAVTFSTILSSRLILNIKREFSPILSGAGDATASTKSRRMSGWSSRSRGSRTLRSARGTRDVTVDSYYYGDGDGDADVGEVDGVEVPDTDTEMGTGLTLSTMHASDWVGGCTWVEEEDETTPPRSPASDWTSSPNSTHPLRSPNTYPSPRPRADSAHSASAPAVYWRVEPPLHPPPVPTRHLSSDPGPGAVVVARGPPATATVGTPTYPPSSLNTPSPPPSAGRRNPLWRESVYDSEHSLSVDERRGTGASDVFTAPPRRPSRRRRGEV